jgi:molybdopterin-binding protein
MVDGCTDNDRAVSFSNDYAMAKPKELFLIFCISSMNKDDKYYGYKSESRRKQKGQSSMKISARNQIKGTITQIKEGAVNAIVVLDIGGGNKISATISMDAINELGLKAGMDAYAIIKATSVMVGTD